MAHLAAHGAEREVPPGGGCAALAERGPERLATRGGALGRKAVAVVAVHHVRILKVEARVRAERLPCAHQLPRLKTTCLSEINLRVETKLHSVYGDQIAQRCVWRLNSAVRMETKLRSAYGDQTAQCVWTMETKLHSL
eukprot:6429262-Pyramimonas_sp.AAC.1